MNRIPKGGIAIIRPKIKLQLTFIILFSGICVPENMPLLVGFIAIEYVHLQLIFLHRNVGERMQNDCIVLANEAVHFSFCYKYYELWK